MVMMLTIFAQRDRIFLSSDQGMKLKGFKDILEMEVRLTWWLMFFSKTTSIDFKPKLVLCSDQTKSVENFWLNGHMDPGCVSDSSCQANQIVWEDGGPGYDESLYDGWLNINIDNFNMSCVQVIYIMYLI